MQALAESTQTPGHDAAVELVISNRPKAYGLKRAESLGVTGIAIDHKDYESREDFERALDAVLREAGIELICCAGFMRVLTPWFVSRWPKRILNIHPSLLPKYKGLNTHERALAAGDAEHGCTVHYVSEELDGGAVIAQARVSVLSSDTPESLAARVLKEEHTLYIKALRSIANTMRNT